MKKNTATAAAIATALAAETTAQKLDLLLDHINSQYGGEENLRSNSVLAKHLNTLRDEQAAEQIAQRPITRRGGRKAAAQVEQPAVESRETVYTDHLAGVQFAARRAAVPATEVVAELAPAVEQPAPTEEPASEEAVVVAEVVEPAAEQPEQPEPTEDDLIAEGLYTEALALVAGTPDVVVVAEAPQQPEPTHPVSAPERQAFRSEALDLILGAAVPASTKTYSPLSHLDLINSVKEQLDKRGLTIKDERYQENRKGQQMFGHMTVAGYNGEQDMCLGFRNSYDKSMQVGVVGGSRVIVCSNMMFAGDFKALAMHNGNLVQELNTMLGKAAERLEDHYRKLQLDSEKMKQVEVNPRIIHEILGELFYSESVVSEAQLRIIRGELREQTNFGDGTIWDLYNHTTEALKTTPSGLIIGRHIEAHQFYMQRA